MKSCPKRRRVLRRLKELEAQINKEIADINALIPKIQKLNNDTVILNRKKEAISREEKDCQVQLSSMEDKVNSLKNELEFIKVRR